ncbi:hypothetical protein EX30DRAFT_55643 [Ascodesmis nigricans]|uniref:Rhodopsin domain-containing protein n=1 Tax=Ascodesmis nigricans TaxID=341454 RepID=A0A4S2MUK5_9PEZI|nr:hypothetical protein EX30DRAFT_55643 [Ascodesmis nigricans]
MVLAVDGTIGLWIFQLANTIFLGGRLWLRLKGRRERLRVSEYLLIFSYITILGSVIAMTWQTAVEMEFRRQNPMFPKNVDVAQVPGPMGGYQDQQRKQFLQTFWSTTLTNHFTVFSAKIALLVFFIETFPTRMRPVLYTVTAIVFACFLANIFETIFWCWPLSSMWEKSSNPKFAAYDGYCAQRLIGNYSQIQFAAHAASTLLVVIVPIILLRWVHSVGASEVIFALTVLGFGIVSVTAAAIALYTILKMDVMELNAADRHGTVLANMADLSTIFWAGCLGVMRFRRRNKTGLPHVHGQKGVETISEIEMQEDESRRGSSTNLNGLVIEVERSYSVKVEIVDAWGQERTGSSGGLSNVVNGRQEQWRDPAIDANMRRW